jgi:hypothetical protein
MTGPDEPAVPPTLLADVERMFRDHGLEPRRPDVEWAVSWLLAGLPLDRDIEPPEDTP